MERAVNLQKLAINILAINSEPISKVRFAKTIYFVHKELIRTGLANSNDIEYIRMPLGPVPNGFFEIQFFCPEITSEKQLNSDFSYPTENYSTTTPFNGSESFRRSIAHILSVLKKFPTSNLVDASHQDPSWINNPNGKTFFISESDLKNSLTILKNSSYTIQASLIRGMAADMVAESTSLEFPE